VWGGGFSEMIMSQACEDLARSIKGKKALAIEVFAQALRQIPTIMCDNGGYDSSELVQNLKVEINKDNRTAGISNFTQILPQT